MGWWGSFGFLGMVFGRKRLLGVFGGVVDVGVWGSNRRFA